MRSESRRAAFQRLEWAGDDLEANQQLQAGLSGLGVGAAAPRELLGQLRRQTQAGAVVDHHAGKPPQQGNGLRTGGDDLLRRRGHDAPEAIGGAGVETAIEALLGDAQFVPQIIDRGLGIVEPAEDQGLDETGAGNRAPAPDHARVLGGLVGRRGKNGLQAFGEMVYGESHGSLLWYRRYRLTPLYQKSSFLS